MFNERKIVNEINNRIKQYNISLEGDFTIDGITYRGIEIEDLMKTRDYVKTIGFGYEDIQCERVGYIVYEIVIVKNDEIIEGTGIHLAQFQRVKYRIGSIEREYDYAIQVQPNSNIVICGNWVSK